MLANDPERTSLLAVYLLEALHNIGRTSEYAGLVSSMSCCVCEELPMLRRSEEKIEKAQCCFQVHSLITYYG
jgi:hypothetical protein